MNDWQPHTKEILPKQPSIFQLQSELLAMTTITTETASRLAAY